MRERDGAQFGIRHGPMGIYNQGAECGSMDEKVMGGNITGKGDSG